MNVFHVCPLSAGEERSAGAAELLPARLPVEFVIGAAGGGGEAKHESSYTLHVLQLAAPLRAAERGVRDGGFHRKLRHYFADAQGKQKIDDESKQRIDADQP